MMDASWNISGGAAQYKTYAKGVAIDDTKPAKGSKPKQAAAAGTYTGFAKKATGKATMYSGVQSADNPFGTTTQYYEGRGAPQRKSLAAQRVKANGGMTETPGQESATSAMQDR